MNKIIFLKEKTKFTIEVLTWFSLPAIILFAIIEASINTNNASVQNRRYSIRYIVYRYVQIIDMYII